MENRALQLHQSQPLKVRTFNPDSEKIVKAWTFAGRQDSKAIFVSTDDILQDNECVFHKETKETWDDFYITPLGRINRGDFYHVEGEVDELQYQGGDVILRVFLG